MSEEQSSTPPAPRRRRAAVPKAEDTAPEESGTATIETKAKKTRARGFTFGKGQVVPLVPIAHAKFLKDAGEAEIIDVQS
ncbi:hypothetical protein [Luteolibacter luteus]|uniref:Uncharacterized protein n=1 Tax=Luteolibacter luteus TaxID=2728835 RepID=A0A858RFS1_9BACT|nr:hypothetical protein [Luteolibacter luteus]QJE95956.1 hypothetical protein HHL09_09235 [Luteolibacter luteus]